MPATLIMLGALVVICIPFAILYLLISNAGLTRRVAALESRMTASAPVSSAPLERIMESPQIVEPEPVEREAKRPPPLPARERAPAGPPKAIVMTLRNLGRFIWLNSH